MFALYPLINGETQKKTLYISMLYNIQGFQETQRSLELL